MEVEVTYIQDGFLTNDVLQEMVSPHPQTQPSLRDNLSSVLVCCGGPGKEQGRSV